jgi:hypothetical protein
MDSNYIEQHLLIDRYLRGTLKEGEIDAFEERLVWDQALVDEVDLAMHLREGLQAAATAREYVAEPQGFNLAAMVMGILAVPQYAAAASFLLAITLTAGVLMNPFVDLGGSRGNLASQTEIVPLLTVRSATVQTIHVDQNAWTVLLVDVMGTYTSYRVTVRGDEAGAEAIWVQDGLTLTYPDALAIGMPGDKLDAGRYVLSLEGVVVADSGSRTYEHIQDIPFETAVAD